MEKTRFEEQYEKLIIHYIAGLDVQSEQRAALFLDFYRNSSTYYEDLCDMLYEITTEDIFAAIWMTHSGKVYSRGERAGLYDIYLMDSIELPAFNGDLTEPLDCILMKIYLLSCQNIYRQSFA